MRFIDLSTWDRSQHYQAFRNSVQPQYCVTFDLDITNFLPKIKAKGYSFTFSFIYAVTKCANQIEAFRCRFVDGKPVVLDTVNTSFTYLKKDTELFKVVNVPMQFSGLRPKLQICRMSFLLGEAWITRLEWKAV